MQVTLPHFLNCLFQDGRVRVPRPAEISAEELRAADETLSAFEQEYRHELPAAPPPLHAPAARWAATMFYRTCQFVAFRDVDETAVARTMSIAAPQGDSPSVHYSVDLTFRYLPGLTRLAQSASQSDPLLTHLGRWAVEWPLSSVAVAGIGPVQIGLWANNPCLLRLYADRIIAQGDVSRLSDQRVREAVQQAIGLFPELASKMAAAVADPLLSQNLAMKETP